MSTAPELKRCPKCGGPIPAEAPQGLCPKCLLLQASIPTEAGQSTSAKPAPPTREQLAVAFPQFEILELIGLGGMGFVFKARQSKLDRLVALKILPQSLATDPAFAERFTREGRMLARLNHPNIVTIHDFGQADGFFYLLMEFVDGVNLRQAMKVGRFTPKQALAIVPKICEALQFAHNEGILHRDIKPENILLDSKGRVKIADFGIAKLLGEGRAEATLTGSGATLGTPHYMAPEQIEKPGEVDHRADIYSLGVVFYEMLTGELPLGRFAPPSEKSAVDPRMDEVVLRALEKERERRPQSAGEVKTQVETIAGAGEMSAKTPSSGSSVESLTVGNARSPKRAIAAAVMACTSLVIFVLGLMMAGPRPAEGVFILLAILGIPALAGTVMGIVILSDLRHAAVQPRGFKPAVLAAVAWPLLLMDGVFVAGFMGFFLGVFHNHRGQRLGIVLVCFCLLAVLMIDIAIVRGVRNWARRIPLHLPTGRTARLFVAGAILWTLLFLASLLWVASTRERRVEPVEFAGSPPVVPAEVSKLSDIEEAKRTYSAQMEKLHNDLLAAKAELYARKAALGEDVASATNTNALDSAIPPDKLEYYATVLASLDKLRKVERELLLKYTHVHPQVTATRESIAMLKEIRVELEQQYPGLTSSENSSLGVDLIVERAQIRALAAKISSYEVLLTNLQSEALNLLAIEPKIAELERRRDESARNLAYVSRMPGLDTSAPEGRFVIDTMQFERANPEPGELFWGFKCFVPPDHLASILFVRWTNGVPQIDPSFSAYFKVGKTGGIDIPFCSFSCYGIPQSQIDSMTNAESRRMLTQWFGPKSTSVSNVVQWNVNLGLGFTSSRWIAMPPYHRVETTLPQSIRSGHQRAIRLVDFDSPEGEASRRQSGLELRILLEPLKSPPIRMVPNEMDRTNYVAGTGLAGTMADALKAIKQWPTDP